MQLGDIVKNEKWNLLGVVTWIGKCGNENCDKEEIALDGRNNYRYHAEDFKCIGRF